MVINEKTLLEVAKKSITNAESLLLDGDLLRENKRIQRAYTLYQLAMEEVGKAISSIIMLFVPDGLSEENIKEYKRIFFKHKPKTKKSSAMDIFICEVLYRGDAEGALSFLQSSFTEDETLLDERKNNSLYTAIVGEKVKNPAEMIDQTMMQHIWFRARSRYNAAFAFINIGLNNYKELREYSNTYVEKTPDEYAKDFWERMLHKG